MKTNWPFLPPKPSSCPQSIHLNFKFDPKACWNLKKKKKKSTQWLAPVGCLIPPGLKRSSGETCSWDLTDNRQHRPIACVSVCALWGYIYPEALRSVWQVGGQEEVEDEGIDKMVQGRWEERVDVRWRNSGGGRQRDRALESFLDGQILQIRAFPVQTLHQCTGSAFVYTLCGAEFKNVNIVYLWRCEMRDWQQTAQSTLFFGGWGEG